MLKTIKYLIGVLIIIFFLSCELANRKEMRTIIKVSGDIDNMAKVKEDIQLRFEKGGFRDITVDTRDVENELVVNSLISDEEKDIFNSLFEPSRLDFWNTYRLSDRELIGVDSLRLDVHNFTSHFAAKQGFVHQNSIGICQHEDSLVQVRENLMKRLADIKNMDLIWSTRQQQKGRKQYQLYMINTEGKRQAPITESYILDSGVRQDPYNGNYNVNFNFNDKGTEKWSEMTRDALHDGGRSIAMVFNNQVLMCPNVMAQITGGQCAFSGGFSKQEAANLARKLLRSRLPFDMEVLSQEFVELN